MLRTTKSIMHIHFIQHEIFEAPGAYLDWAISRNHKVSFTKVFEYNLLPETVENIDVLIVMGGPQSPNTSKEECPYFDAKAEINFIRKMINNRKAVVGACLGAQLIGEAMGAAFERSPEKEIGVLPITLTQEGLRDNKIKHFGNIVKVGHWHSDMPGLTEKCNVLAKSFGCPRQIISYSNLVYGFQCHPEFTPEVVEMLIAEDASLLMNNTTHKFVQTPNEIRNFDYTSMNEMLYFFLDKLAAEYIQCTLVNK